MKTTCKIASQKTKQGISTGSSDPSAIPSHASPADSDAPSVPADADHPLCKSPTLHPASSNQGTETALDGTSPGRWKYLPPPISAKPSGQPVPPCPPRNYPTRGWCRSAAKNPPPSASPSGIPSRPGGRSRSRHRTIHSPWESIYHVHPMRCPASVGGGHTSCPAFDCRS